VQTGANSDLANARKDEEQRLLFHSMGRSIFLPDDMSQEIEPVQWRDGYLRVLDQTRLPADEQYFETDDHAVIADAIRRLAIRGAPLIGIAAAYAVAMASRKGLEPSAAAARLADARPTAVNLRWAAERVAAAPDCVAEAIRIHQEQIESDRRCGEFGAALIDAGASVLTHCNTGTLATGGIGSALGVVKTLHARGKRPRVYVGETRPLLQGARLTAWELQREGVPYRIVADGAAAGLIACGDVHAIVVGADRIAANGDTANKVGTYGLALAAYAHSVPFYVVAPVSTIDSGTSAGDGIKIEERAEDEVLRFADAQIAPAGARAVNPAFDITPHHLITAIITERGALRPPLAESVRAAAAAAAVLR
jgi:methylthioribose-1-phosphate isomerase